TALCWPQNRETWSSFGSGKVGSGRLNRLAPARTVSAVAGCPGQPKAERGWHSAGLPWQLRERVTSWETPVPSAEPPCWRCFCGHYIPVASSQLSVARAYHRPVATGPQLATGYWQLLLSVRMSASCQQGGL